VTTDLRGIKLLLFDVDGVLTDGTILVHPDGSETKQFHIRDGAAIVVAQRAGLTVALLSGRTAPATTHRARQLGITHVIQGASDKVAAYEDLLRATGVTDAQVAYMGDDLPDLPVLQRVGFSAAPADAPRVIREHVSWVSSQPGGSGAVRELIERIMDAQGLWTPAVDAFLQA
jgi:3-deoxy-D-manno-octulosonate 8-phosphate phosphatase (KDO 8-P phosphatase)